jgi:hypothetical protein
MVSEWWSGALWGIVVAGLLASLLYAFKGRRGRL